MKPYFLFALCMALSTIARSQTAAICKWDSDKKAAVVLTFDDWSPGQYPIAVSELKKRNMNATFFVMLSSITTENHPWPAVVTTAANGNEIGSHTQTHPDLTKVSADQLSTEVRGMKDILNRNVPSQRTLTFAYPFGALNPLVIDSVRKAGYIAARTVFPSSGNYTYNFATREDDYFRILTYGMDGSTSTAAFYQQVNEVMNGGGLLTFMYHSVDNTQGTYNDNWYAKVLQDSLQKQFDVLLSVNDKVWITTFSQAIKYHREATCATITEVVPFNGKQWIIDLADTLSNNALYNQPLSIKVNTKGVRFSEIYQAGSSVTIDTAYQDVIVFHAIPDGGQIILRGSRR